jgi:hypothetical protein
MAFGAGDICQPNWPSAPILLNAEFEKATDIVIFVKLL